MAILSVVGFVGGAITTSGGIPQIIKMVRTKRTEDLSWSMLLMWLLGLGLTSCYGIASHQPPVYASSITSLSMTACMALMKWRFERVPNNPEYKSVDLV